MAAIFRFTVYGFVSTDDEGTMVIDCHFHLEERGLSVAALMGHMDRCGIRKTVLMGSIIGPFPEPPKPLIGMVQFLLENPILNPVGRVLVSSFTDQGEIKILGTPYPITSDPDNEKVFATVERHPGRFWGWVFVNPRGRRDPLAEFETYRDHPGFAGVKAHPFWHRYPLVELVPVAERAARAGKPLLVHVGFGPEGDFEALLDKVPGLKLILAHAGFPGYARTWEKIQGRPNVYLDLSQTSYTSERATRLAAKRLGTDRLLFGTDGPAGFHGPDGRYDYGFLKRRIERLFPNAADREKLLGGNFRKVAGLD